MTLLYFHRDYLAFQAGTTRDVPAGIAPDLVRRGFAEPAEPVPTPGDPADAEPETVAAGNRHDDKMMRPTPVRDARGRFVSKSR